MKLDLITVTKIMRCYSTSECRKWRNRFENKKSVVLTEFLSNRQIAADIEEKWANQGKVIRGRISLIYISLSSNYKPCHGAINSRPRNLRIALKKYFRFPWNCKQLRIEARNSMENCEIYFLIFSKTIYTILKIFSQYDLRKVRYRLL